MMMMMRMNQIKKKLKGEMHKVDYKQNSPSMKKVAFKSSNKKPSKNAATLNALIGESDSSLDDDGDTAMDDDEDDEVEQDPPNKSSRPNAQLNSMISQLNPENKLAFFHAMQGNGKDSSSRQTTKLTGDAANILEMMKRK